MTTGIYFHEKLVGNDWPIVGDRYQNFPEILEKLNDELYEITLFQPDPVSEELLLSTHGENYLERVKQDWYYDGALLTIGGCVEAATKVWSDELKNAICFLAAAGHHAHPTRAWGGTYLSCIGPVWNSLKERGLSRMVYLDTDSHHGDGAREVLEMEENALHVCFCGSEREEGKSNTCIRTARRSSDEDYLEKVKETFPKIKDHNPEIIIHFFGHDTHKNDYGNRGLTESFFPKLANLVQDFADEVCEGKYVIIDGGGANVEVGERIWPDIIEILAKDS